MTAADKMKAEALAVFGGLEYPELARDVIEWFHASILVQQEQAGWQPMDTVPRDMHARLYLCGGIIVQGFADACGNLCVQNERYEWRAMRVKPTHWQPLPAAPKGEKP